MMISIKRHGVVHTCRICWLVPLALMLFFPHAVYPAPLNPAREVIVASSNFPSISLLSEALDLDGKTLIAKGLDSNLNGIAAVFDRHLGGPDRWNPQALLYLPGTENNNIADVSICGDFAVVSSILDDTYGTDAGSVHIFYRNYPSANDWGHWKSFGPPGITATNRFGWRIDVDDEYLAVGSRNDDLVFLYARNAGGADQWGKVREFSAPLSGQFRDASVRLNNGRLVIGSQKGGTAYLHERNSGGTDNWGQMAQLNPSDNATNLFGCSVAIWGETVVVGAYTDDDGGGNAGAAYIYTCNTGGADSWGEVKKVIANDAVAGQNFGRTVDIWNDTIMLSADGDTENPLGGAAYILSRNKGGADNWGQTAKLSSLSAYALSTPLVRGVATGPDLGVASVNFNGSLSNEVNGVRVFQEYVCREWDRFESAVILTDSNTASQSDFGTAVSLYGDTLAVGSGSSTNADGLAYIYERNEGGKDAWGLVWKSLVDIPESMFGASLSLDGDILAVGAPRGLDIDYGHGKTGYVKLFARNSAGPDIWGNTRYLVPTNGAPADHYGEVVELDHDWLFVGAPDSDIAGANLGAVYIHHRNQNGSNSWGIAQTLIPTNSLFHAFGDALSADKGRLAIGDGWWALCARCRDDR